MSITEQLISKLIALKENDLTRNVLMPLLKGQGWDKVEFHGGPYEEGKDIICWRKDEWGDVELGVAQVKRYKPSAVAGDEKSFMELVNQIQQAAEIEIPNPDGYKYAPSRVYCFTPYALNTRALQTRFEKYSRNVKERQIKIIDGAKIAKILIDSHQDLVSEILGKEETIRRASSCNIDNKVLLGALNYKEEIDIAEFYCDLEFILGNINTRMFYNTKPIEKDIGFRLSNKDWQSIRESLKYIEGCNHTVTDINTEEIENKFKSIKIKQVETNELLSKVNTEIDEISICIKEEMKTLDHVKIILDERSLLDEKNMLNGLSTTIEHFLNELLESSYIHVDFSFHIDQINKSLKDFCKVSKDETSETVEEITNKVTNNIDEIHKNLKRKNELISEISTTSINLTILSKNLYDFIEQKRQDIENNVNTLNSNKINLSALNQFLESSEKLFTSTDNLLRLPEFGKAVGITKGQEFTSVANCPRLEIGLDFILDTGKSFAIYGEAGAGKTTSLQMYAKRFYESGRTDKIVAYIPLAIALGDYDYEIDTPHTDYQSIFIETICNHLNTFGAKLTSADLLNLFKEEKVTLLLDGIDEALTTAPWITDALQTISVNYPTVQLVMSARIGLNYQDKIPFIGASLMEFTDKQRSQFIKSWFKQANKEDMCPIVVKHLEDNGGMAKLVKNPLLATILCVLANNKVPLPTTEFQLYEERLRLLFGDYDTHKKISRVNSHRQDLEKVARKAAYKLHKLRKREITTGDLIDLMCRDTHINIDEELVKTGITDLLSPCNILTPMNEEGSIGFGHLRYQEFLSAKELTQNRSVEIGPLLFDPWWKGVLRFYAQMADDIEHVFEFLVSTPGTNNYLRAKDNMREMLLTRPENEREYLTTIFESNLHSDVNEPY